MVLGRLWRIAGQPLVPSVPSAGRNCAQQILPRGGGFTLTQRHPQQAVAQHAVKRDGLLCSVDT